MKNLGGGERANAHDRARMKTAALFLLPIAFVAANCMVHFSPPPEEAHEVQGDAAATIKQAITS